MLVRFFAVAALVAVAMPAGAVTFFSLGGAPDPGLAPFETSLATFDAPNHPGIIQTNIGNVSANGGAAPAGDTSHFLGIGDGGSATFDFRGYFADQSQQVRSLSVYVGSVDTYNHIDILDSNLHVVSTINGADMPASNGDQGAAITNRRLYINFDPSEAIGGLTFWSNGWAFEFDTIAASTRRFLLPPGTVNGSSQMTLPPSGNVPEPESWVLLIAGFGLIGVAARRRRMDRTVAA